jgi:transposase
MMGKQDTEPVLFSYQVNLDTRVRADHPLRKIKEKIDFSFARRRVSGCYGKNGNVSVDPEVILKMMFLLFYEDTPSERELMRTIPERLDWMWFLGYGLDDAIPDHSVLSKARSKWGPEVFERLFVRTIHQCMKEGLVGGDKIHMDSSLIAAHASKNSILKGGPELIAALKRLYRDQEQKLDPPAGANPGTPANPPSDPNKVNAGLVSTTDPEAAVVRHGNTDSRPRYKSHRAVDDIHGVITAVDTTPGDVPDHDQMMDLVDQHEANTGQTVGTAVADAGYGTVENFQKCFHRGIESHMADRDQKAKGTGSRKDIFDETRFQ